jgi:small redox-active disulfide protein 2
MKIQILGTGCPKCKKRAEAAETAAKDLQLDFELEKITDINEIMSFGVMMTPALAIDGDLKVVGKVPTINEVKEILSK